MAEDGASTEITLRISERGLQMSMGYRDLHEAFPGSRRGRIKRREAFLAPRRRQGYVVCNLTMGQEIRKKEDSDVQWTPGSGFPFYGGE